MGHRIARFDAIIVAIGSFNPAIVTPEWLHRHDLISQSDLDECKAKLQAAVEQGLMSFNCQWFAFRLLGDQMVLSTLSGITPRLRDLAHGILTLLPETPLTAIGLNIVSDIQFDTDAEYQKVGDVLNPKEIWRALYPDKSLGMASLTVIIDDAGTARVNAVGPEAQRRFTIQPSNSIGPSAAHVAYNHHYPVENVAHALEILDQQFLGDQTEAESNIERLIRMVMES